VTELEKLKSYLRELTALPGISGAEGDVARCMAEHLRRFADRVDVDDYGDVMAERHGGTAPSLMIAAHSDEVGAMVRSITADGFLRFHTIGFVGHAILPAARVLVAGKFPGVVGAQPAHLETEADRARVKPPALLHIDVGAQSEAEVRAWGIREGDQITFVSELVELHNASRVMGKAIDNRIGCAVLLSVFEALRGEELPGTLYGVANVQEEIGSRGARMSTARLKPDWAIALDTVPADDTPLASESLFSLGKGPVIQLIEGRAEQYIGTIIHPRVRDYILQTAEAEEIPVQLSAAYGSWTTDAALIHVTGEGVPTGFVSIARRYAHSPNEVLDLNDAIRAVQLLTALVRRETTDLKFALVP
jgi:putative aminopeptidase FrvX